MTEPNSIMDEHQTATRLFDEGHYEEAFKAYHKLAESGSVRAQLLVGWMYHAGQGVTQNFDAARDWYRKAADAGSPEGQYYLGTLYRTDGQYEQAISWFEKAASQGYARAFYGLGKMHEIGEGVTINQNKAYEYFERAANLGHMVAKREIAVRMIKGQRGLTRIPIGLCRLAGTMKAAYKLALDDPDSDQFRR